MKHIRAVDQESVGFIEDALDALKETKASFEMFLDSYDEANARLHMLMEQLEDSDVEVSVESGGFDVPDMDLDEVSDMVEGVWDGVNVMSDEFDMVNSLIMFLDSVI